MVYEEFDSPRAYDLRQLKLMRVHLRAYLMDQQTPTSLPKLNALIKTLEALGGYLQQMPDVWREQFHQHWANLEDWYSWIVVCNKSRWSRRSRAEILNAARSLLRLVEKAIAWLEPMVLEEELRFYGEDEPRSSQK